MVGTVRAQKTDNEILAASRFLKVAVIGSAGYWAESGKKAAVAPKDSYGIEQLFMEERLRLYSPDVRARTIRVLAKDTHAALCSEVAEHETEGVPRADRSEVNAVGYSDMGPDLHRELQPGAVSLVACSATSSKSRG